jgi:hypothetical protein
MKLTANTPIRYGTKELAVDVAEGETFDFDQKTADALLAAGAATLPKPKPAAKAAGDNKGSEPQP